MNIFLVTSFIHPYSESVFSPHERLLQTINTISSINKYYLLNKIYILEGSGHLTTEEIQTLSSLGTIIRFDGMNRYSKSFGECFILKEALKQIKIADNDIVYKISGRYYLTDKTEMSLKYYSFHQPSGRPCFATTFYSIPGILVKDFIEILEKCMLNMISDIEHGIFHHMNKTQWKQIDRLNCKGLYAPNGEISFY